MRIHKCFPVTVTTITSTCYVSRKVLPTLCVGSQSFCNQLFALVHCVPAQRHIARTLTFKCPHLNTTQYRLNLRLSNKYHHYTMGYHTDISDPSYLIPELKQRPHYVDFLHTSASYFVLLRINMATDLAHTPTS